MHAMAADFKHSRRAFLQGRAAARLLADQAVSWMEKTGILRNSPEPVATLSTVHLLASRRAMACEFQVQYHAADGPEATEAAVSSLDIVDAIEDQLTIYRKSSDVVNINTHASREPVFVEKRLFELLRLSRRLCRETDGAFDIATGPLSRTWGFLQRAGRLPDETEIASARRWVGIDHWQLDRDKQTIALADREVEINFNAIGKGYALDQAAGWLASQGMHDYLLHGGRSSVLASGRNRAAADRPSSNGRRGDRRSEIQQRKQEEDTRKSDGWTVGLPHPLRPNRRLAEFHLRDQALATAGSGTQYFERENQRYGHLIDPRTGMPATGVLTATVLAPTAAEADALATAFYILGPERTGEYCNRNPEIKSVLVCPAKRSDEIELHPFGLQTGDWTPMQSLE